MCLVLIAQIATLALLAPTRIAAAVVSTSADNPDGKEYLPSYPLCPGMLTNYLLQPAVHYALSGITGIVFGNDTEDSPPGGTSPGSLREVA
jgi:hypothetical protein